ncbi:DNA (cytosine-5-)-methyltransferase [Erysipelothrix rhusiopathiae]|nr:DNA (cytosine-5-)-methyltransferase [Erysipelothrix rhusiopathiae]
MKKTVVELFAGVGGFRVGLNNIKSFNTETGKAIDNGTWEFVWANQWEPSTKSQDAFNCYVTRFGEENVSNEDIEKVDKKLIPDHNLLVGGFPCQDYSVARSKSNEKGIEGKKGVLFWEIAATLEAKNTPFFLLENVDRLLKTPASQRGRDFGIMIRTLTDLEYNIEWRVINAADYGRGQRRRRVFIFGWKNNLKYNNSLSNNSPKEIMTETGFFSKTFPIADFNESQIKSNDVLKFKDRVVMTEKYEFGFENTGVVIDGQIHTVKTEPLRIEPIPIIDNLDTISNVSDYIIPEDKLKKFKFLRGYKKIERRKPNGETYYYTEGSMSPHDNLSLPARTMLTSERSTNRSTHIILDPNLNKMRYITPVEAERFQDFPDNWTNTGMSEPRRYFMMGNALVTGLVSVMEKQLSEIFKNEY